MKSQVEHGPGVVASLRSGHARLVASCQAYAVGKALQLAAYL